MHRTQKLFQLLIIGLLLIAMQGCSRYTTYFFGEARVKQKSLPENTVQLAHLRTLKWQVESRLADSIYSYWARKPLGDWQKEGKVNMPRKLLGNLLTGTEIPEVNAYIGSLQPWGNIGSTWFLHQSGDYDFTVSALTSILFLFDDQPEVLYPETKKHILEELLVSKGGKYHTKVPRSLGLIKDTENHLLMGEGSRYLKNRYMVLHGNQDQAYDNMENGMEEFILELLNEIQTWGLYEFNSIPYLGYTFMALLNLEAFGSETVRNVSRDVLDFLNYSYALGSYSFRYYPPFRRRLNYSKNTSLSADYHSSMMMTWMSFLPGNSVPYIKDGLHHALLAACMPYRPPDDVVNLIENKKHSYYVQLGHGRNSSPEIYAAGPDYLLSAGGCARGKLNSIVARPVCLFLDDNASDLSEVFHIKGKSDDFMNWNNTGVYRDFACANGPVHIPEGFKAAAKNELWDIYTFGDIRIAVHSRKGIGILALFMNEDPVQLAEKILHSNSSAKVLQSSYICPEGHAIRYDVNAAKRMWVIEAIDNKAVNRRHEKWALINWF